MVDYTDTRNPEQADKLAFYLNKTITRAVKRYHVLEDRDRILVAVSGGKDSLTLLDLLHRRRRTAAEKYTLIAAHVQSDYSCGLAVPEPWIEAYCHELGVPYVSRPIKVADELEQMDRSRCFRCAWERRKALFALADELGCNKLAFGHHADDYVETVLLNLFYAGRFEGMEGRGSFFDGQLTIIRPLIFLEEKNIPPFVRASGFPIGGDRCPESLVSRRTYVKQLLRQLEDDSRGVKRHIHAAGEKIETLRTHQGWLETELEQYRAKEGTDKADKDEC